MVGGGPRFIGCVGPEDEAPEEELLRLTPAGREEGGGPDGGPVAVVVVPAVQGDGEVPREETPPTAPAPGTRA